jgi:hypothetical protein
MGNTQVSWQNAKASECLQFLNFLLGKPYVLVRSRGGVAVWNRNDLSAKTLFGKNICFEKIMIKDSDKPVYVFAHAPVQESQSCEVHKIMHGVGYDDVDQMLWARCDDMDSAICALRYVTDFLVGKNNVDQSLVANNAALENLNSNKDAKGRAEITKAMYNVLCVNLTKLLTSGDKPKPSLVVNTEHMHDDPWYGGYGPYYASNNPGNVALGEAENELYYRRQTETPVIFPKLEGMVAKTSGKSNGKSANCRGACAKRYMYVQERMKPDAGMSIAQAYQLFMPNKRHEHMALMNSGDHITRLEHMEDADMYKLFQSGSGVAKLQINYGNGSESFSPSAQLTWPDAVKLFTPKSGLNANLAYRSQNVTLDQGRNALALRGAVSVKPDFRRPGL